MTDIPSSFAAVQRECDRHAAMLERYGRLQHGAWHIPRYACVMSTVCAPVGEPSWSPLRGFDSSTLPEIACIVMTSAISDTISAGSSVRNHSTVSLCQCQSQSPKSQDVGQSNHGVSIKAYAGNSCKPRPIHGFLTVLINRRLQDQMNGHSLPFAKSDSQEKIDWVRNL